LGISDKTQVKIRLNGIVCPETGQDFRSRGKQRTSELAFGKTVTVRPHNTDRYGRTVAEIILPDGESLNHQLVCDGLAWWYRTYAPKDRELAGLEREARDANRGLWSQGEPIPPWEWRKGKRPGAQVAPVGRVIGNRRSMAYHSPECRSGGERGQVRIRARRREGGVQEGGGLRGEGGTTMNARLNKGWGYGAR
jgi:micrococcal nuclease